MTRPHHRPLSILPAVLVSLAVLGTLAGCGYRLRADGRPVGLEVESLAIPLMTSTSSRIAFEPDFTKVIREEFISHANVPVLPRERAQMVLIGHVRNIQTDPLTYDLDPRTIRGHDVTYAVTDSRRLRVELDAKLVDRATGNIVWQDSGLSDEARFEVSPDPLRTRHNQREALRRIAGRLAKRVYLKTMERF
ncbi:MAG: hypothetical protein K9M82_12880 [Deltaproteobacteria bacterium]|nr:hypothetical protein [Deltaproteobacteria bacterium]